MSLNITHDKKDDETEHKPVVNMLSEKPEEKTEEKTEKLTDDVKTPEMKAPKTFQVGEDASDKFDLRSMTDEELEDFKRNEAGIGFLNFKKNDEEKVTAYKAEKERRDAEKKKLKAEEKAKKDKEKQIEGLKGLLKNQIGEIGTNVTLDGASWDGLESITNEDGFIDDIFNDINSLENPNFKRDWLSNLYKEASTGKHKNDEVAKRAKAALDELGEESEPDTMELNRRREAADNSLNTLTVALVNGDIKDVAITDIEGSATAVQLDLEENPEDANALAQMEDLKKKAKESGDDTIIKAVDDGIEEAKGLWKSLYEKNRANIKYDTSENQIDTDRSKNDYGYDDLSGLETIMQGEDGEKKKEIIKNVNRHISELEERLKDENLPEAEKQEIENRIRDLKTQRDSYAEKLWLSTSEIAKRNTERNSMDDFVKRQRAGGFVGYYKREKDRLTKQLKAAEEAGQEAKAEKIREDLDALKGETGYFIADSVGTSLGNIGAILGGQTPTGTSEWSKKQGDILKAETERWNQHWDEQMGAIDKDFATRYNEQDEEMQAWNELKNNYDLQMQAKHLGLLDKTFDAEAAVNMQKLLNTKDLNQTMQIMSIIGESDPEEMIFMLLGRSGLSLDGLVQNLGAFAQTIADNPGLFATIMGLVTAGKALL